MVKNLPGLGRCPGERNGNPLQYSMDRGAWQATVHEAAKSQTWLSDCHFFLSELGVSRRQQGIVLKSRDPAVQEPWNPLAWGKLLPCSHLLSNTSHFFYPVCFETSPGSVTIRECYLYWLWCYFGTEPDLPCDPVVKILPFQCRGLQVQSLVREVLLCDVAPTNPSPQRNKKR